jgi:hypothetical protein
MITIKNKLFNMDDKLKISEKDIWNHVAGRKHNVVGTLLHHRWEKEGCISTE